MAANYHQKENSELETKLRFSSSPIPSLCHDPSQMWISPATFFAHGLHLQQEGYTLQEQRTRIFGPLGIFDYC